MVAGNREGQNDSVEMSLSELAAKHQQAWASDYVEKHGIRRVVFFVLATLLSSVEAVMVFSFDGIGRNSSTWDRYTEPGVFPFAILLVAVIVDGMERLVLSVGKSWALVWSLSVLHGSLFCWQFAQVHHPVVAVLYALIALSIPAMAFYVLHIPRAPHVPWDVVEDDFLINVRSAHGGVHYPQEIFNYEDAERTGAAWLRRFGYRDAQVTKKGKDDGIDVIAVRAIAQVKWWRTKNVGISDVQRLPGAAKVGQLCFFFAAKGYTREALKWASDPDRKIALFVLHVDGNVTAVNYGAKKALWGAPRHIPKRNRKPLEAKTKVKMLVFPVFVFLLLGISFMLGLVTTPAMRNWKSVGLIAVILSLYLLMIAVILGSTISRVVHYLRLPRAERTWLGWRHFLRESVDDLDIDLASDRFVGFENGPPLFKVYNIYRACTRNARTIRRFSGKSN
ncbi:restriction endonuclease [Spirillospora sp. NPDC052269]